MIKLGHNNKLRVGRFVDFGAYLTDDEGAEVLLPARYVSDDLAVGDEIDVFVYKDSEDRPVATTDVPYVEVGQFAFLQVVAVNKVGAFLDWGLPKDLLVPFSEQKARMQQGGIYLVYVYLDNESGRIVASAKVEKYLGNLIPAYKPGQRVEALVWEHTPIGYKVIVDNLFQGMLYQNELYRPVEIEETVDAYVKMVRPDGKIDLTLGDKAVNRVRELSDEIMERLKNSGGSLPYGDKSSPDDIKAEFKCSKRDFKQAIGRLYKEHRIVIDGDNIALAEKPSDGD